MPGADDKREETENEEGATEGAIEGTWGHKAKRGARGRTEGATGIPGGAGEGSEGADNGTEDEAIGKGGAIDNRKGRGETKEEEEGKPGRADTEEKDEKEGCEGGREEPKPSPVKSKLPP